MGLVLICALNMPKQPATESSSTDRPVKKARIDQFKTETQSEEAQALEQRGSDGDEDLAGDEPAEPTRASDLYLDTVGSRPLICSHP